MSQLLRKIYHTKQSEVKYFHIISRRILRFLTFFVEMSTAQFARLASKTKCMAFELQELIWRLLELHMVKITLLSVMLMAVNDVSFT